MLITGFFYVRGSSFSKLMKRSVLRILVPAILLMIFNTLLSGWLDGEMSIVQSISAFKLSDLLQIVKALLVGNTAIVPYSGHLWYVCMYIFVMLWFPLLKRFDTDDLSVRKQKWTLMALTFVWIIVDTWSDRFGFFRIH